MWAGDVLVTYALLGFVMLWLFRDTPPSRLPIWALVFSPPLWASVAALSLAGLANGPIDPLIFTSIQEKTPGRLLARVNGASLALARGAAPVGAALAGWFLGAFGLGPVLVAIASGLLVVSLALVSTPALRGMDTTEDR